LVLVDEAKMWPVVSVRLPESLSSLCRLV